MSVVEDLLVLGASVGVGKGLQSGVALRLEGSREEADLVHFEHGLEQILSAVLQDALKLGVARVVVEPAVVQVRLLDLHRTPLVAQHELLERQETVIPTITFFICHKL